MADTRQQRLDRAASVGFAYEDQPKITRGSCNLCGSKDLTIISNEDRYGYPAAAKLCTQCGLVFLDPVMTAEGYKEFYINAYRPLVSAYYGKTVDAKSIQDDQAAYAVKIADEMQPFMVERKPKTLLDIGGSTGIIAKYFQERFGLTATVLDPSPDELAEAKKQGLRTRLGLIEDDIDTSEKYDCMMICRTVDHLLDIAGSLKKIRSMLTPNGLFFIDIVDFVYSTKEKGDVLEVIKIDHPYYISPFNMRAYLERAGFKILFEGKTNTLLKSFVCSLAEPILNALPSKEALDTYLADLKKVAHVIL